MKLTRLHLTALAVLAAYPLNARAQQETKAPRAEASSPVPPPPIQAATRFPSIRINSGPLLNVIEQLNGAISSAGFSEMNVVLAADARSIPVPDLTLRNVDGPDALKLIAASAGCEQEVIAGADGKPIGYRVFAVSAPAAGAYGMMERFPEPRIAPPMLATPPRVVSPEPSPAIGLSADAMPAPARLGADSKVPGQPAIVGFGGMPGPSPTASNVRVYGLGGIIGSTDLKEIEKTLYEVLKADIISSQNAKIAFHDRTNVLVVTGEPKVHEMVGQYLEALQKNVSAAAQEHARDNNVRQELIEANVRIQAEIEARAKLTKQLEETEAALREAQRELDRRTNTAPKPQ